MTSKVNGTSYPHLHRVLAYHTRIVLHNDPQIVADQVQLLPQVSFRLCMEGISLPPGALNKITFAVLILFALVEIHCPPVCELHIFR
jgi:hypothetical protein